MTFQQVQKYEKGMNRVGGSGLPNVANVPGVPASSFFNSETRDGQAKRLRGSTAETGLGAFLQSDEGRDLKGAFARIAEPAVRRQVISLVKAMAATAVNGPRGDV